MQSDFDFFDDIRRRLFEKEEQSRRSVSTGKSSEAFFDKADRLRSRFAGLPYGTAANPRVPTFHNLSENVRWLEAFMRENAGGMLAGQSASSPHQQFAPSSGLRPGEFFRRRYSLFNRPANRGRFIEELELLVRRKRTLYNKSHHF